MTGLVCIILVSLFFAAVVCSLIFDGSASTPFEAEHIMDWHRVNGRFRVLYPDGKRSQPFSYKVACDYRDIFGGTIERLR